MTTPQYSLFWPFIFVFFSMILPYVILFVTKYFLLFAINAFLFFLQFLYAVIEFVFGWLWVFNYYFVIIVGAYSSVSIFVANSRKKDLSGLIFKSKRQKGLLNLILMPLMLLELLVKYLLSSISEFVKKK